MHTKIYRGLYRTFYYNLGDDSFLYGACCTAGPLQPVNVQRGPGLPVGGTPGARSARRPRSPRGAAGCGLAARRWGENPVKKVRRMERVEGDHAPPPHSSGVCFTDAVCAWPAPAWPCGAAAAGASRSSAGSGCTAQPAQHSVCVRISV